MNFFTKIKLLLVRIKDCSVIYGLRSIPNPKNNNINVTLYNAYCYGIYNTILNR